MLMLITVIFCLHKILMHAVLDLLPDDAFNFDLFSFLLLQLNSDKSPFQRTYATQVNIWYLVPVTVSIFFIQSAVGFTLILLYFV